MTKFMVKHQLAFSRLCLIASVLSAITALALLSMQLRAGQPPNARPIINFQWAVALVATWWNGIANAYENGRFDQMLKDYDTENGCWRTPSRTSPK